MDLHTIEICAGVGMLGEGLRAGLGYLGVTHRTIAYLEREAYAASVLAARMEEGSLDAAPIWSDLLTFDGQPWRGVVDCIAAGFPCQDLSLAGKRAGLDGARSGLFFNILDIADACGAWCMLLENVAGIASATASVVDEAEGALDERAAARVLGELADRGWHAEWLTLSASDVGASHGRARWFCWAWRELDDAGRVQRRAGHEQDRSRVAEAGGYEAHDWPTDRSSNVAHAERSERRALSVCGTGGQQGHDGGRPEAHGGIGIAGAVLAHADQQRTHRSGPHGQQAGCAESALACGCMADPTGHGRNQWRAESGGEQGRPDVAECGGAVADTGRQRVGAHQSQSVSGCSEQANDCADGGELANTSSPRQQGAELGRSCIGNRGGGQETHGPTSQLCGLFAPGPADMRWAGILAGSPHLAPALEPTFRSVVNGLAFNMDDCRAARLKCVGNGVVPLAAAAAVVMLLRRAGFVKQQPAPVAARNEIKETV